MENKLKIGRENKQMIHSIDITSVKNEKYKN